ncbi:U32 family peptidase [Vibrio vulnificus]|nr:hypothetical protein [Vibrio vulnificus]HAS8118919.1 hypothetical protein [Vibrio vulnificus]
MNNYSVPAMFNQQFIDHIETLNNRSTDSRVTQVYGALKDCMVGSIMPKDFFPEVQLADLKDYCQKLEAIGVEFNYVMNSITQNGKEYDKAYLDQLCDFIADLQKCGINNFTIAEPSLIRFVHQNFPEVIIKGSITLDVTTKRKLKYFIDMGVKAIVVSRNINRDPHALSSIISIKKKHDIKIELLATTPCLWDCPSVIEHAIVSSQQSGSNSGGVSSSNIPYPYQYCSKRKIDDFQETITIPVIRPEEVDYYTELGVDSFKFTGRLYPRDYIQSIMEIYFNKRLEGNYFYLVSPRYPRNKSDIESATKPMYLENELLDQRFEYMQDNDGCEDCDACKICHKLERKVVFNAEWRNQLLNYWSQGSNRIATFSGMDLQLKKERMRALKQRASSS